MQCTIGHGAIVHACTIEDEVLVGMGARVLDGAVVRRGSIVAAGALVPPNTEIPAGQVWAGCPAKFLRELEPAEEAFLSHSAENYAKLAAEHWFENTKTYLVRRCSHAGALGLVPACAHILPYAQSHRVVRSSAEHLL